MRERETREESDFCERGECEWIFKRAAFAVTKAQRLIPPGGLEPPISR